MATYTVEYRLKKQRNTNWWYVQGVVRNVEGRVVRYSAMTAHCTKPQAERMFKTYSDSIFLNKPLQSGDQWRGAILP